MADGFYLVDEKSPTVDGKIVTIENVLFFRLEKAGYDGRATKEHLKDYVSHYANFKLANPDYKLPWGEDVDFVGKKVLNIGEVLHTPVQERFDANKQEVVAAPVDGLPSASAFNETGPNKVNDLSRVGQLGGRLPNETDEVRASSEKDFR